MNIIDETELHKQFENEKDCQKHPEHCECARHMFCSQTTIEALRITLSSTIDLIDFLFDIGGYDFVLTAKFNQDCIEASTIDIVSQKVIIIIIVTLFV